MGKRGAKEEMKAERDRVADNSIFRSLQKNIDALNVFIDETSEKYSIPSRQILELLGRKDHSEILIPSSIFRNEIGILQAVVKYLKENMGMAYNEIAEKLQRDDRVVWTTYSKAIQKNKAIFRISEPNYYIPLSVFAEKISPMSTLSKYLVENAKMSMKEISGLLNRNRQSVIQSYRNSKNGKI